MRPKRLIGQGWPKPQTGLRHDLALSGASGEPAGRSLSQLVCDAGQQATHRPTSMHRVMAEDAKAD